VLLQDTGAGLRAVDQIAERLGLDGVYGPLYRLFEVTDDKFNTAVELTAGNRYLSCVIVVRYSNSIFLVFFTL
jgi:structural maintenance of chromosome 3 (chondroitin sulfate proteoglycan 6)